MRYALLASVAAAAFMSATEQVETVIITTDDGPVRINKSDFDEEKHTLDQEATDKANGKEAPAVIGEALAYAPGITPPPAPSSGVANPTPPQTPSPGQMAVAKKGKKFIAVYFDGTPVVDTRIDPAGYDTEALAWEALMPVVHNPTPLGSPPVDPASIPGAPGVAAPAGG